MPSSRFLLLPLVLLQLLAAYLPAQLGFPTIGERAIAGGIPPELPTGPFFAIWGVIYLTYILFGIYALRRDTELSRRLSFPLAASGVATAIWMLAQQILGIAVLDLLLLGPLVYFSWNAALNFDKMRGLGGSAIKWTADVLTGLLSGWAIVALAISVPRAGRALLNQGPTDSEWIALWSVLIVISIATWFYKEFVSRTAWYYWAAAWGLLGILVNNWTRTGYGYFGWIVLFFGGWLIYRRIVKGANGSQT